MKKLTTKQFIEKAKTIHNDKYDYFLVNYTTTHKKVKIICFQHGVFEQTPACHLSGQGCKECKRFSRSDSYRLTTEKFIEKANKVHKNKYYYNKTKVKGNKNKVTITCPIHKNFKQSPNSHLRGNGCKKCSVENKGYGRSSFIYFAKDNICRLYLIEVYNEEERFLKIGITSKSIDKRFSRQREMPYNYKILLNIESKNALDTWEKEIKLKRKFNKFKYKPELNFKGYTECFKLEQKENIINYLNK